MKAQTRVVMFGIDAADALVVRRLLERKKLPALSRLIERGCSGSLHSPAMLYAGGVWPSFYTGQDVPWHGIYHNKLWRPSAMRCEVPDDRWLSSRPFWESLVRQGLRVCVIDVPMVIGAARAVNGCYVGGWGTHDLIARGSWPGELWRDLVRAHGAPAMPPEWYGRQDAAALLRLRADLLRATEQLGEVAIDLIGREPWDFFCVVFGATHRAGHYLWDLSQIDAAPLTAIQRNLLDGALEEVYVATDHAIDRLSEHVGGDALVIAFAVHGMDANPGWSDLVPDLLDSRARAGSARAATPGLLYRMKRRLPFHWFRPLLTRLPAALTDRLVSVWSARMYDWSSTTSFPVPMDHAGYVRLSLRGRERYGVLDAGDPYERACGELQAFFLGLRDAESGEALTTHVLRAYAEAPREAPGRELLPDLVIPWTGRRARDCRTVECDGAGMLRFEVPRRLPSGRSGNHTDRGWFAAAGPRVPPGCRLDGRHILDLAPTVLECLGAEPCATFQGRPFLWPAARAPHDH